MMETQWATARTYRIGPILDQYGSPYVTATIASTNFLISKNGAAGANPNDTTGAVQDGSQGYYLLSLNATDHNTEGVLNISLELANYAAPPLDVNVWGPNDMMLKEAIRQGYRPGRDQVVQYAATSSGRGTNLATAHDEAVTASPTSTDWVTVFLPPWVYDLTSGDEWDTDYIHYKALFPEKGGNRAATDTDSLATTATNLKSYRPPRTVVTCTTANTTTINQSATKIRMTGFAITQLSGDTSNSCHALHVTATNNDGSFYDRMYFWHLTCAHLYFAPPLDSYYRHPVHFDKDVAGCWVGCIANAYAWRIGYDGGDAGVFSPTMIDCQGGQQSFIGDYPIGHKGTHKATKCFLLRCKAVGIVSTTYCSGFGSFAGCLSFGNDIDDSCVFIECEAGSHSFGIGSKAEGVYIRCRGGDFSFASTTSTGYNGEFAGYAYDCIGGKASFGGAKSGSDGTHKLTGTLNRCRVTEKLYSGPLGYDFEQSPWRLEGATVINSSFKVWTDDIDVFTLLDGNCKIYGNSFDLPAGSTGKPINAASAMNVVAAGNVYSNKAQAASGLGSDVTNLATSDSRGDVTAAHAPTDAAIAVVNGKADTISTAVVTTIPAAITSATQAAKLAADGLDSVATTAPSGVASNFREMLVQIHRFFFKKSTLNASTGERKTYADNGTDVLTTQTVSDNGTTQTIGDAS